MNYISNKLFSSIAFSICAFLFLMIALFLLFFKMRKNTERKNLYFIMIILTLVVIILEMIICFTIPLRNDYALLNEIICRLYLYAVFLWPLVFMVYMFSYKKEYLNKKFYIFISTLAFIFLILCVILPLKFENASVYTITGPLVIIMNIYCLLISIFEVFLLLLKKVQIRNLSTIPLFLGTGLYMGIVFFQILTGEYFNIMSFMYTLIIIVLFYSSESQDYQLLEEFAEIKSQSEIVNQNKDDFLTSMSNEIRTPMSNILGLSDLILLNEGHNTVDSIRFDGKNIHTESINLLSIINNILDLARYEANKETLNESNYTLEELILELNNYIYEKYKLLPIYSFKENLPNYLYGDSTKIKKILSLIIDDELKKENIESIQIAYDYSDLTTENIKFNIKISFIFKVLLNNSNKNNVLDLESSIVNLCSKIIGATIIENVISDYKVEYEIKLEQTISDSGNLDNIMSKISSSISKNEESTDYSNKKILVVDDSQMNINILKRLFSKYNFALDEALSGERCIELMSQNKYDIVFLDDMMPGLSGVDTLKELKNRYNDLPPIIALTANSYDGLKEKYIADGFTDYLAKPIESSKMDKILNIFLNDGGGNNAL